MGAVVINSEEYAWGEINVVLLGKNIAALTEISYKKSQEKKLRYGRGVRPTGISRGNKKYEGSITILQSEYLALEAASPNGDILDLRNLDIVFSFGDKETGILTTKTAKFCEFTEAEEAMKQGDSEMPIKLPFVCLDIQ